MSTRPLVRSYRQDMNLFPGYWHRTGLFLSLMVLFVFPFIADDYWLTIGNKAMVTIVGSMAMMILAGFAGQISLGHAAFFALGAYTAAILGTRLGFPFWLNLPLAGLVACAVGLLVGPFALRLRGLYLAIVTLGLIYLVNHFLMVFSSLTGGASGIGVPMHTFFTKGGTASLGSFSETLRLGALSLTFEKKLYLLFLLITILVTWFTKNLQRSKLGRAMMAVRDHDLAAEAMGIQTSGVKVLALAISSFIAGMGGAMFGFLQQFITIDPPFNLEMSVQYIAIIVVGGIGSVFGAIAGALAFVFLSPIAELVGKEIPYLNLLTNAQQSVLLFSLMVGAILLYEPLGIFGIWLKIKRFFMSWPFRY